MYVCLGVYVSVVYGGFVCPCCVVCLLFLSFCGVFVDIKCVLYLFVCYLCLCYVC